VFQYPSRFHLKRSAGLQIQWLVLPYLAHLVYSSVAASAFLSTAVLEYMRLAVASSHSCRSHNQPDCHLTLLTFLKTTSGAPSHSHSSPAETTGYFDTSSLRPAHIPTFEECERVAAGSRIIRVIVLHKVKRNENLADRIHTRKLLEYHYLYLRQHGEILGKLETEISLLLLNQNGSGRTTLPI
jgi:hypothetical protein